MPVVASDNINPATIIQLAIERNISPESMDKLVALAERIDNRMREQAFSAAMTKFKEACPPVPRRTENTQFKVMRNGVQVFRKYATLEDIEATIRGPLGECGLSYRWGNATVTDGKLTIECIISHAKGHHVSSSTTLPVTSNAGCSEAQKYGAALTYGQRFSLIQALGLTSCEEDDDGNDVGGGDPDPITENQVANLQGLIDEVRADKARFLKFMGVKGLGEIPSTRFKEAVRALEAKRGKP